jgi:DNA-directed RNA polymerase sigma subunit (sigma70/sigma32)
MGVQILTESPIDSDEQLFSELYLEVHRPFASRHLINTPYERELFERMYAMRTALQRLENRKLRLQERLDLLQFVRMGQDAREQLIRANMGQVISAMQKFQGNGMPVEGLIQEGNLGLSAAVDSYDINDSTRFADYAAKLIDQAIGSAITYLNHNQNHLV